MLMDSANSEGVKRLVAATGSAVFLRGIFFMAAHHDGTPSPGDDENVGRILYNIDV